MQAGNRFVVADDHPMFRGALRQAVSGKWQEAAIVEAASFEDTTRALADDSDADLILLDLNMPGMHGFSGLAFLRAQYPGIPVLVVSGADDPQVVRRCLDFGAAGFLPKTQTVETMREAIAAVLSGGTWTPPDIDLRVSGDKEANDIAQRLATLTPQQVRVLMMLSEGLLNKQIAYELDVSEATVKAHVSAILMKLGVESRTQAVIAAAKIDASRQSPVPA
jgi:DNA-binding NarL/FixJ family response regulator